METYREFITVFPLFFWKSVIAIFCGGVIGLERERRGKPAGLRTNILICLGSTLYMIIADFILMRVGGASSDPSRIASQVVTGIGFIGAGTIIQSQGTITGLTSAAVIWTVAAIGLCIGAGFGFIAIYFTLLVLFVLVVLTRYENLFLGRCHFVETTIAMKEDGGRVRAHLNEILREHEVTTSDYSIEQSKGTVQLHLRYCDKHPSHNRFLFDLWRVEGTTGVKAATLSPLRK